MLGSIYNHKGKTLTLKMTTLALNPGIRHHLQLFRERFAEKVHATLPKDIVGGKKFTALQRNLKEWHGRLPLRYVCEC